VSIQPAINLCRFGKEKKNKCWYEGWILLGVVGGKDIVFLLNSNMCGWIREIMANRSHSQRFCCGYSGIYLGTKEVYQYKQKTQS